jgi:ParB-like chromosome segregation protein Spo0J
MARAQKGRKHIDKTNEVLGELKIEYVAIDSITPNDYNPNRQSEHDFELLLRSMEEDGFTQPIIAHKDTHQIVDGEHRWRAASHLGLDTIPVVFVDMAPEQMKIATLRHNRARGSEDVELSAQVLRDLQQLGALDWAQDSLMLDDVEINLLLEDIPAPEALAAEEFSQAWEPGIITDNSVSEDGRDTSHGTVQAVERLRSMEKKIQEANTEEEKKAARKDADIFRLNLTFTGEEAIIVKGVVGNSPAEAVLRMCKEAQDS